ncbi:type IV toxin-antitoxin system AbiEi family antitoxin domain-containing protein [Streptomyces lunaelactis]|uniref:type IV toxin-antitoxin system AbiEi family antitoxin domain-containing protein n=1 Tax=Streptomyces lunaelactis TaxID=1535768 RepID=UPI0015851981|nr:type IV toxin-antitoxin system AbiEi family antitoxin domain-containing protein [Streptomyces lunaelactis]NUK23495.1 type IV toxin-antitoxin system AbiEi family antitoxin domain-containing protein [Streptomyces lunaelactis]
MERSEAVRAVSTIAADQWGLVTTAQAAAVGVSRVDLARLADIGLLQRAAHSVYQVPGATPATHLDIKMAWLRLDPSVPAWQRRVGDERSGVVSHASACQLHELGDIPADNVEITVPRRRTTREPGVTFHLAVLPAEDVTVADGLPVTTVDRTICDLLKARADAGHIGRVVADADHRGLTDTRLLGERVQPYARFYGLPRTTGGSDLLESLAEQAGFTLRDQQITTAGERAAVASALIARETALEESFAEVLAKLPPPTVPQESLRDLHQAIERLMADNHGEFQKRIDALVNRSQARLNLADIAAAVGLDTRTQQERLLDSIKPLLHKQAEDTNLRLRRALQAAGTPPRLHDAVTAALTAQLAREKALAAEEEAVAADDAPSTTSEPVDTDE